MGPSTLCEQCGKKLKVFSKRTKCMHCMAAVCKACYAPHVIARHPTAVRSTAESSASASTSRIRELLARDNASSGVYAAAGGAGGRATIATAYELHGGSDDDVHFLSPDHAHARSARPFDSSDVDNDDDVNDNDDDPLLDDIDGVELVSAGEDDDDDDFEEDDDLDDDDDPRNDLDMGDDDDEDDEDDDEDGDDVEPYLPGDTVRAARRTQTRRMSVEEEHHQHAELLAIQDAVATWARKEADATRAQRIAKRDSCYSMTPIPNVRSTREYQERELFVVSYAVAVTLLVWAVYAVAYFAYIRVRSEVVCVVV